MLHCLCVTPRGKIKKKNSSSILVKDNLEIEIIRRGQPSSYELTFKVKLDPDFFCQETKSFIA